MNTLTDAFGQLIRLAVRLAFVAAGAVFFLSLLLAGVVAAAGFTLWSLLRGRRPVAVDVFRFQRDLRARGFGRAGRWPASPAADAGEVVEVQAREVVRADQRLGGGV
jgi:hypothetical protein